MEFIINVYQSIQKMSLEAIYEYLYEYLYLLCNCSFNYCPLHYQMVYFYFPILYLILRKYRSKYNPNYNQYSTSNYMFIVLKNFFKKINNFSIFFFKISICFKKIYFFIKLHMVYIIKPYINVFKKLIHNNHPWFSWKPVFKKLSYFGIFSFIRTKWYKNK